MQSLPTEPANGVFHAVATRDGEAWARDGHEFFEIRRKGTDTDGVAVFEIRFGDGLWMLATAKDLEMARTVN